MVQFGDNLYGIRDACNYYFQKSPAEINPEEAAFLAFLLPNPPKYSQSYAHKRLTPFAEKTVKTILHKMDLGHKITDEDYASAIARVPLFPWGANAPAAVEGSTDQTQVPSEQAPTGEVTSPDTTAPDNSQESNTDDDNFKFDFTPEEN